VEQAKPKNPKKQIKAPQASDGELMLKSLEHASQFLQQRLARGSRKDDDELHARISTGGQVIFMRPCTFHG
jgi:hypothetical protein